jgi:hypothetical protein
VTLLVEGWLYCLALVFVFIYNLTAVYLSFRACRNGELSIVQLLIKLKADLDVVDVNYWSAAHHATNGTFFFSLLDLTYSRWSS